MRDLKNERGVGIPELLVTVFAGTVVLIAVFSLIQITGRSTAQVVARVDANQRSRPVLERILDELHSSCLSRDTVPVFAGSSDTSLSFIHQTGAAVTPSPVKRTITLNSGTLTETVYPLASGTVPEDWVFSNTPSSTTQLLTKVGAARMGNPAVDVPLFRYYTYTNGLLDPTPLPATSGLTAVDAARTVQVTVAFSASPLANPSADVRNAVSVAGSAVLRFSPPSADTTKVNGPCG
jgi:hypothetical protein